MADELEDGWQPTTPPGDTIVRRFVLSVAERGAWVASRLGGRVMRTDDVVLADFGSSIVFDNAVVLLKTADRVDLDAIVAQARESFGGRPWVLFSALPTPDLSPLGLQLMGHPPAMIRSAGEPSAPTTDLDVVEVTDAEGLATWNETFHVGYPSPGDEPPLLDERVLGGDLRFWTGFVDGRPVATSAAWTSHGINDVEYVATLPEYRGRGFGAAVSWPATCADPDLPALLIASDPGRPVYERMGYFPLLRFTLWYPI